MQETKQDSDVIKSYTLCQDERHVPVLVVAVPAGSSATFVSEQIELARSRDGWIGAPGIVRVVHRQAQGGVSRLVPSSDLAAVLALDRVQIVQGS